jgi:hypothetical protein
VDDIQLLDGLPTATATPRRVARGPRVCKRQLSAEQLSEVERRHAAGASRRELAEVVGVSVGMLGELVSYGCLQHLPRRRGFGGGRPLGFDPNADHDGPGPGDPSPRQIRERAAAIRANWTAEDIAARLDRMDPRPTSWTDAVRSAGIRVIPTPSGVHID